MIGKSVDVTWISLVKLGSFGDREECGKRSHCPSEALWYVWGLTIFAVLGYIKVAYPKFRVVFSTFSYFFGLGSLFDRHFSQGSNHPPASS